MTALNLILFAETSKSSRASETHTSFTLERPQKLLSSYQFRRATLSPLHLVQKSLEDSGISEFTIDSRQIEPKKQSFKRFLSPFEKPSQALNQNSLLNTKKLSKKIGKLHKGTDHHFKSETLYIESSLHLTGKNPIKPSSLASPFLPKAPRRKLLNLEREVKLRVKGTIKSFSPRPNNISLEPAIFTFK